LILWKATFPHGIDLSFYSLCLRYPRIPRLLLLLSVVVDYILSSEICRRFLGDAVSLATSPPEPFPSGQVSVQASVYLPFMMRDFPFARPAPVKLVFSVKWLSLLAYAFQPSLGKRAPRCFKNFFAVSIEDSPLPANFPIFAVLTYQVAIVPFLIR